MLRTLSLSLSGVLLGMMLAAADYRVDWKVALFLLLAVTFLHLYSVTAKNADKSAGVFLVLTIACGLAMLYFSFGTLLLMEPLILMVFGYMIIRAVKHTYFISRGKGIIYVFALFGLVGVMGPYYVCSHSFGGWPMIFPALSMGLLSVAAKADDDRFVFRLAMNVAGWAAMTAYACLRMYDPWHFLFIASLPVFFLKKPQWPPFAFAILTGMGFMAFLL